jgi:hypothetical protein
MMMLFVIGASFPVGSLGTTSQDGIPNASQSWWKEEGPGMKVWMQRVSLIAFAWGSLAGTAYGEVALQTVNACISDRLSANEPVTVCIDAAHADCNSVSAETPAIATLCLVNAEKAWSGGIAGVMSEISELASEDIAAIAAIEVKYDLLSALLQCDRMEELQLVVGRESETEILRMNARCKARATALTYARLFVRSRDLQ